MGGPQLLFANRINIGFFRSVIFGGTDTSVFIFSYTRCSQDLVRCKYLDNKTLF